MDTELRIDRARELLKKFTVRTGLTSLKGDPTERYLWTDAFGVQALFALSEITGRTGYARQALKLIELVHEHLGQYHPRDSRKGWISGLPEKEARVRPVTGGLRIGKKLPERRADESYNSQLE